MNKNVMYGFGGSLGLLHGLRLLSKVIIAPGIFTNVVNEKLLDKTENGISYKFLNQNSRRTILYCHGNSEHIYDKVSDYQNTDMYKLDPKANYMFFNYRGYGNSKGYIADQETIYSDTKYIYEQITNLIPNGEIIVWGFSLGSYPAIRLCSEFNCKHLILHAPMKSIPDVIKDTHLMHKLSLIFSERYDNSKSIKEIKCPVDILHSREDDIVPFMNSLELAKLCNISSKNYALHEISGTHNDNLKEAIITILQQRLKNY